MRWLLLTSLVMTTGCAMKVRPPKIQTPQGKVPVEVISAHSGYTWNVYAGGKLLCETPCTDFVGATEPLFLDNGKQRVELWEGLSEYKHLGPVRVRAVPHDRGKMAGGIIFTSFGGMGMLTGGGLALGGALDDPGEGQGLLMAGGITALVSTVLTVAGIVMMVDSSPHPEFYAFDGETPVRIMLAPGLVTAQF